MWCVRVNEPCLVVIVPNEVTFEGMHALLEPHTLPTNYASGVSQWFINLLGNAQNPIEILPEFCFKSNHSNHKNHKKSPEAKSIKQQILAQPYIKE
ncbi:hypothetical protein HUJ04_013294 [Dendroctonus ponderosae]|nr:hypothetical protein HUJ04_013294 [Dendroctonus ponderosae]